MLSGKGFSILLFDSQNTLKMHVGKHSWTDPTAQLNLKITLKISPWMSDVIIYNLQSLLLSFSNLLHSLNDADGTQISFEVCFEISSRVYHSPNFLSFTHISQVLSNMHVCWQRHLSPFEVALEKEELVL